MANAIYSNARAKYQENFLLGKERILRIVDAENFSDALKVLSEVNFGGGVYDVEEYEFEKIIDADRERYFSFIRETCPSTELKAYLLAPSDYHNAEALLKAKHLKLDQAKMTTASGLIDLNYLKEKIFSDSYKDLPVTLSSAILKAEENLVSENRSGAVVSLIFKKALYSELYSLSKKNPILSEIYSARADFVNVSIALRCGDYKKAKEQFVEGGTAEQSLLKLLSEENKDAVKEKIKNFKLKVDLSLAVNAFIEGKPFSEFERVSEGYAVGLLEKRKYEQGGIIPFIHYCFMKESEYKNVRIALSGIINGMDKADVKRRLF